MRLIIRVFRLVFRAFVILWWCSLTSLDPLLQLLSDSLHEAVSHTFARLMASSAQTKENYINLKINNIPLLFVLALADLLLSFIAFYLQNSWIHVMYLFTTQETETLSNVLSQLSGCQEQIPMQKHILLIQQPPAIVFFFIAVHHRLAVTLLSFADVITSTKQYYCISFATVNFCFFDHSFSSTSTVSIPHCLTPVYILSISSCLCPCSAIGSARLSHQMNKEWIYFFIKIYKRIRIVGLMFMKRMKWRRCMGLGRWVRS